MEILFWSRPVNPLIINTVNVKNTNTGLQNLSLLEVLHIVICFERMKNSILLDPSIFTIMRNVQGTHDLILTHLALKSTMFLHDIIELTALEWIRITSGYCALHSNMSTQSLWCQTSTLPHFTRSISTGSTVPVIAAFAPFQVH